MLCVDASCIVTMTYSMARKQYKTLLKDKTNTYLENEGLKLAAAAAVTDPFVALRQRKVPIPPNIQVETRQTHFTDILNPTGENRAYPTIRWCKCLVSKGFKNRVERPEFKCPNCEAA